METDPANLRISDSEREDAIRKLGEHMSDGRLGMDEYGDRTARVATAKTRRELLELFTDLPDPRPVFGGTAAAPRAAPPAGRPAVQPSRRPEQPLAQRLWGALVPLSAIAALIVFLTVWNVWFVFLAPAAVAIIGGAIWGEDWRNDRRRPQRHRPHG